MTKKKKNWSNAIIFALFCFGFFILGMVFGMIIEQRIIGVVTADALSLTDIQINVNINETKMAQELNQTFIPAWKQAFNETIQNDKQTS